MKPIPERVEEILNDPWLQPIYDSSISNVHKREALETLVTRLLTETDQQARETERGRIRKVIEAASLSCGGYKRSSDEAFAHGRALNTVLEALSNPPSQV